jgi:hypothetical protein
MSGEMLQNALVTLIALLAMVVIVRRIAGFVGLRANQTHCACPSSKGACGGSAQPLTSGAPQPLTLMVKPPASPPRVRLLG